MPTQTVKIAAMACCYNRIEKTKAFLQTLTAQHLPDGHTLDIYLLDDQSPDATGKFIRENYPEVNLLEGSGSLFWAGGMRMLWAHVMKAGRYDFYLLLNDDVKLFDTAVADLITAYKEAPAKDNIIIGSVLNPGHTKVTYGGRKITNKLNGDSILLTPNAGLQECDLGNANVMLVDKATVDKIGILSSRYIHSFGDFDYTLNAKRHGSKVWVAPGYFGSCDYDHGKPWLPASTSFKKRLEYMRSPKGIESASYLRYVRKFFPFNYPAALLKIWLKTLLPVVYDKYKKD